MKSLASQRGASSPSVAGISPVGRISGCRISPPAFAALAIRPMVIAPSSNTRAVLRAPEEVRRREYHKPYHAATPVASMKISPINAER